MNNLDSRTLVFGFAMLALGSGLLFAAENFFVRYAGGVTAFAIGLGALRHGFRIE